MRFRELQIETLRQRPARAKTEAESLLIRAGYLTPRGALTALADRAISRLRERQVAVADKFAWMGLTLVSTDEGEVIALEPEGDFQVLYCQNCGYASAVEAARARKDPAPNEEQLAMERVATPDCNTIASLAAFLGVSPSKTAKAMFYSRPGEDALILAVIRGDMQISDHKLHAALGALVPATREQIERAGATPGYASPIGLTRALVVVDDLIPSSPNLIAGANVSGFHLKNTNYGRDYQASKIADLTLASPGDGCHVCGRPLEIARGFVLADRDGLQGMNVLLALAARWHDDRGLVLPVGAAPFDVYLLDLPWREVDTKEAAARLYRELETKGVSVLLDDRDERAGVKFNDADLIGCPLRVTVGERNLARRMVELKARSRDITELIPLAEIANKLRSLTLMPR